MNLVALQRLAGFCEIAVKSGNTIKKILIEIKHRKKKERKTGKYDTAEFMTWINFYSLLSNTHIHYCDS